MTDSNLVGRRAAAGLIDVFVVFVLFLLVGVAILVWVALAFVYYYGAETRWARTLGKWALGLRVERLDGRAPTGGPIAVIGFVAVLTAGTSRQRLGDLAAGTAVVRG